MSDANVDRPGKTLVLGALFLALGVWFWHSLVHNPFDDLALIQNGQKAKGILVETAEDEQDDAQGRVYYSDVGSYSFHVSGEEFIATTRAPTGTLRASETIEFLHNNPRINRISGDGAQSILEWTWRKLGLGLVLLAMFTYPGLKLCWDAILGFKQRAVRSHEA